MTRYCVIIGSLTGCYTQEDYSSKEIAEARVAEWRKAGYTAQAFEVRINLETLEVFRIPIH